MSNRQIKCCICGELATRCIQHMVCVLDYETAGINNDEQFDWSKSEVIGADDYCDDHDDTTPITRPIPTTKPQTKPEGEEFDSFTKKEVIKTENDLIETVERKKN